MLYEVCTTYDRGGSPHISRHDLQLHPGHTQLLPWILNQDIEPRLISGAQEWTNLLVMVAQSTAFHRCIIQALAYLEVNSSLTINYDSRYGMDLSDSKGARSKVEYLPPNMPINGLGFKQAIDGNKEHEFNFRVKKIDHMRKAAVSIKLCQTEVSTMLNCRLVP